MPDVANTAGKVVEGADFLIATARATLTPPANHEFGDSGATAIWPPVEPLWRPAVLGTALVEDHRDALDGASVRPRPVHAVFPRAHSTVLMEGPSGGIIVAERLPSLD
ncbi:hypothetical protein ACODNH_00010 (plasmid) [Haloarcula sp. NS06]|uniref:hypothetical protein n=1 Tax=Haloarcula sp. NS06 TaxID=3409688 RepID=UPI003DA6D5A3